MEPNRPLITWKFVFSWLIFNYIPCCRVFWRHMKVPQYVPAQSSCKFLVGISVTLVICLRRLNTMLPASSLSNGKVKKFALFFQVSWLSTNCLRSSKGGGGSVILVMRYAVDASATPYIKTPHRGILSRMKKPAPKPNRTPSRSWNHDRFCCLSKWTLLKYGSSWIGG